MRAIIGDRMAASVKIFDAVTRQEITKPVDPDPSDPENPMIPVANHGTAVDPATGNIYVVNPNNDRIEVWNQAGDAGQNADGITPFRFGSSGTQPGQLRDPVDAVISQGVLYVPDEGLSRVQAFDISGTPQPVDRSHDRLRHAPGRWGSTFGSSAYDFRGAIGLDADAAGRISTSRTRERPDPGLQPEPGEAPGCRSPRRRRRSPLRRTRRWWRRSDR